MTRLTVATITCRSDPRLLEMAATLATSAQRAGCYVQWVLLDERAEQRNMAQVRATAGSRVRITHAPAPASPLRVAGALRPAHSTMRNAALREATGDYVVWLDDCTLVTADWVQVALEVARTGAGWRCQQKFVRDMQPFNRPLVLGTSMGPLRAVAPMSVGGVCWGAPLRAMLDAGGYDLQYDGLEHGADVDLAVRMAHGGLAYCTSPRAVAIRLERTARRDEVTSNAGRTCLSHVALLAQLAREPRRVLPIIAQPLASTGGVNSAAHDASEADSAGAAQGANAVGSDTDGADDAPPPAPMGAAITPPIVVVDLAQSAADQGPSHAFDVSDVATNGHRARRRRKKQAQ